MQGSRCNQGYWDVPQLEKPVVRVQELQDVPTPFFCSVEALPFMRSKEDKIFYFKITNLSLVFMLAKITRPLM